MTKFFRFPFGLAGDRLAVPEESQPDGTVSYQQGYGPNYALELGVSPNALPFPRAQYNQSLYDLTDTMRDLQLAGASPWFPASVNGGVAIPYPVNASVRHNDLIWRSLIATNTVEPGTDPASWRLDIAVTQATDAVAGITRYSSDAEALARVATDRAVTPANLGALFNLLLNQPIFPEVAGAGTFTVTSPGAGTVRVAAGTTWTMRGAFSYTSALIDLMTVASKTYHLRWDKVNGFVLYDLANGTYNPSAVAETDPTFDSTYDNMLVARVVTSAGNVATITTLINKARLAFSRGVLSVNLQNANTGTARADISVFFDWARTPTIKSFSILLQVVAGGSATDWDNYMSPYGAGGVGGVSEMPATRYGTQYTMRYDFISDNFRHQVNMAA